MMADSIRFGKVSNINYKTGCMEVTYEDREDSVTDMIPMLANAGYKMPKVGDTVVVAHNSNGEEEGVGLGTTWGENERKADRESGKLHRHDSGRHRPDRGRFSNQYECTHNHH